MRLIAEEGRRLAPKAGGIKRSENLPDCWKSQMKQEKDAGFKTSVLLNVENVFYFNRGYSGLCFEQPLEPFKVGTPLAIE